MDQQYKSDIVTALKLLLVYKFVRFIVIKSSVRFSI